MYTILLIAMILVAIVPFMMVLGLMIVLPISMTRTTLSDHKKWHQFCHMVWNMPSGIGSFFGAGIGLIAVGFSLVLSSFISAQSEEQRAHKHSKQIAAAFQGEIANIRLFANEVSCLLASNDTSSALPYPDPIIWRQYAGEVYVLSPDAILALSNFYGWYEHTMTNKHRSINPGETQGAIKAKIAGYTIELANLSLTQLAAISGALPEPVRKCKPVG